MIQTYTEKRAVVCKICKGSGRVTLTGYYSDKKWGQGCSNCMGLGYVWRVLTFVRVDQEEGNQNQMEE